MLTFVFDMSAIFVASCYIFMPTDAFEFGRFAPIYIYKSQTLKSPFRCDAITPEPLNRFPKVGYHVKALLLLSVCKQVS